MKEHARHFHDSERQLALCYNNYTEIIFIDIIVVMIVGTFPPQQDHIFDNCQAASCSPPHRQSVFKRIYKCESNDEYLTLSLSRV